MADAYYKNDAYVSMNGTSSWGNIGQIWNTERQYIMDKPWYDDFIKVLREHGDLEDFLKEKNAKVYQDYMYDKAHTWLAQKPKADAELKKAQDKLDTFDQQVKTATYFHNVVETLAEAYPEEKKMQLRQVLQAYLSTGEFNNRLVADLMAQPSGLIDKIKYGRKIAQANEMFTQVMENCQKRQVAQIYHDAPYGVKNLLSDTAGLKLKSLNTYQDSLKDSRKSFEDTVEFNQRSVRSNDESIAIYENIFQKEIAPKLEREDGVIRQYVEDLKKPKEQKQSKAATMFLNNIKDLDENETVFFNFMMHPKKRFETMMQELGFEIGSGTDKWMCYVNENGTSKKSEVWSPVMTVKEARKIMPLILDNMEISGIEHQGVIMPISEEKLKDIRKGGNEVVPQFNFQQALTDFLKECQTSENKYTQSQIEKEYMETSLFNGTMVSDDYFPWSKRAGRNGVVYAGVNLGYVLQYDGARTNGTSGTTDFYMPTKIGEVEIHGEAANVTIGFVNVYEQAKGVDRFYPNFGMEDNAIPYFGRPEMDSETFVTPQKNPLKAKFMHICIGGGSGFFYKIPDTPSPFVQYILDQRKGDVRNTFQFSSGYSPLARLYTQADEVDNGIVIGSGKKQSLSEFLQKAASPVEDKEKEQVNETVKIEEVVNKAESVKKEEPVAEVPSVQQTEAKSEDKATHSKYTAKNFIEYLKSYDGATVEAFGKTYPLDHCPRSVAGEDVNLPEPNTISFQEFLPEFFSEQKEHFDSETYYEKMVSMFPQYKKGIFEKIPSEEQIETWITEATESSSLDGASSVPLAEGFLGIKIGGGYKYPNNMTTLEYAMANFKKYGFYFGEPESKKEAYMAAWEKLHFPDQEKRDMHKEYQELVELNPQLKKLQFDTSNDDLLGLALNGVGYNFPVADIQFFINQHEIGVNNIRFNEDERMKKELAEIGVDHCVFGWVPSSETIKDIGRKLKEKEQVNETVKIEEPVNKEESVNKEETGAEVPSVQQTETKTEVKAEAAKSPKEAVAEKLKALGIEDGTYMLIDKNDDFYTLYSGANGPEGRSVKGYLESGEEQIAKTGKDAVYCSNNGIVGAYFKEGVYVITPDYELKSALRFRGEETSLGVMLSNGECFVNKDGKIDESAKALNLLWRGDDKNDGIRGKGNKVYAKRVEAYQARQKWLKELDNASAADKVHHSLEQLCALGDKYDNSGQLKETLATTYIKEPDKMLGLEFWSDVVNKYAEKTPESKDKMILEISKVGGDIAKEVKLNGKNQAYKAVKKRCEECQKSADMIDTAKVCSMRSHSQASEYQKAAASR